MLTSHHKRLKLQDSDSSRKMRDPIPSLGHCKVYLFSSDDMHRFCLQATFQKAFERLRLHKNCCKSNSRSYERGLTKI